jgi:hypothetical protein
VFVPACRENRSQLIPADDSSNAPGFAAPAVQPESATDAFSIVTANLSSLIVHPRRRNSFYPGVFGTGGRIDLWSMDLRSRARSHVETWKKLRRYLLED